MASKAFPRGFCSGSYIAYTRVGLQALYKLFFLYGFIGIEGNAAFSDFPLYRGLKTVQPHKVSNRLEGGNHSYIYICRDSEGRAMGICNRSDRFTIPHIQSHIGVSYGDCNIDSPTLGLLA